MSTYLLPGGSGFLGQALSQHFLAQGHTVIVLTRRARPDEGRVRFVVWDGKSLGPWTAAIEAADAVINLAGRSVNCRYTEANRREIFDSRVDSTRVLGEAIALAQQPPAAWLNASTATIYRYAEDRPMDEHSGELGQGMSVQVAQAWEQALWEAETPGVRKLALRTSLVLDHKEGALPRLAHLAQVGMGGPMSHGRQYVSWLHVADFVAAVDFLLGRDDLSGPFNLTAPDPQPNTAFMRALRQAMGVPVALPQPKWLLEFGAWLIGTETELILKSRRVLPTRLLEAGFEFRYGEMEAALGALVGRE